LVRSSVIDGLSRDVGYAARALSRNPGTTAVMLLTLMLGAGATTAIFSVVNGVLLRELEYPEADRIVFIEELSGSGRLLPVTTPNFYDWRDESHSFRRIAVHSPEHWPGPKVVLGGNEPVRALVISVSEGLFEILGAEPTLGRPISVEEHREAAPVALVSHSYWRNRLGARTDLGGTKLTIDTTVYSVIGVLPAGFGYPAGTDIWVPWKPYSPGRSNHNWVTLARLRDGTTFEEAQVEISAITGALKQQHGSRMTAVDARLMRLRDKLVGDNTRPLMMLLGAGVMVLLVACANVASVQLARGMARTPDLALRVALGAGRRQLIQQLFVESLLVAIAGAFLGLLGGLMVARGLLLVAPDEIVSTDLALDLRVLGFTVLVAVGSAILFGLLPAYQSVRAGNLGALRAGGRGYSPGGRRGWQAMVIIEVAATVVLLVGATLLMKSFSHLMSIDTGFSSDRVLTVDLSVPESRYPSDADKAALFAQFEKRLGDITGVEAIGLVSRLPLVAGGVSSGFEIEGSDEDAGATYRVVSSGYFGALEIPLLRGRLFDESDTSSAPHVALLNQTLAEQLWPGEDPIGRRIRNFGNDNAVYSGIWASIVGVVADVRDASLAAPPSPTVFLHVQQRPFRTEGASLTIRTAGPPGSIAAEVRRQAAALAADVPVELATFDSRLSRLAAARRFTMTVAGIFAAIALILAAAGIYGVVSYTVAQRTRELGIRAAMGATDTALLRMMMAASLRSVLAGALVGAAGVAALTRVVEALLFDVSPADPTTFAIVAVVLTVTAGIATLIPARRAARIDPVETLRGP